VEDDGSGSMTIWYWVTGVGVAILAAAGAYAPLRHHEAQTRNPIALARKPRRSDAVPLLGWIGGIAGLVLGASAALSIFPPEAVSAPMLFMAGIGVIIG